VMAAVASSSLLKVWAVACSYSLSWRQVAMLQVAALAVEAQPVSWSLLSCFSGLDHRVLDASCFLTS